MKKLIIKYSIEFFVIVFSISVSFFVENIREENEKDNQRILIKQSLLDELKLGEAYVKNRKIAFDMDLKAIKLILNKDTPLDSIYSNISSGGFSNPFIIPRQFNPPSSVYKSLVNDGDINILNSQKLKILIEDTYVVNTKSLKDWAEADLMSANKIRFYIIDNYPEFFLKDFNTKTNKGIMLEFHKMVQKDAKLKAYLKNKTIPMTVKKNSLDTYINSRDQLVSILEELLK